MSEREPDDVRAQGAPPTHGHDAAVPVETPRTRTWPGRIARIVSGLAVVGVVGAVAAVTRVPSPADQPVAPRTVGVPPAASTLVCPGGPILPTKKHRTDSQYDPVPVAPVTSVRALTASSADGPGSVTPLAGGNAAATLDKGGDSALVAHADASLVARAQPGDAVVRLGASSSSLVSAGDLRGLVAGSCVAPAADAWLVGGSTELSSTAQLVLLDAGTTPARVDVELWGPNGPVDATSSQYLVAPGGRKVVELGGVAAQQRRLVAHVSASGGRVAAFIQDASLDGFTPTGTTLVEPGAAPSTTQVVPGVSVTASTGKDSEQPALRLLAPSTGALVSVSLLGPAGEAPLPGATQLALPAGVVTDVPLTGLAAGDYTAVVHADQPVVAAATITRAGAQAELGGSTLYDRAWAPSATPGRSGVVAVPSGVDGTVVVSAVGPSDSTDAATGTIRVLGEHGKVLATRTVTIGSGTTGSWTLAQLVTGDQRLTAGVQSTDDEAPPVDVGDAQSYFPALDQPDAAPTAPATTDPGAAGAALSDADRAAASQVVGLDLVLPDGGAVRLVWSFVATVTQGDGTLVAVVAPVPVAVDPPSVTVERDTRSGLR